MPENEIRLYFKLKNDEEHIFLKITQEMKSDDKSIYLFPLIEKPELKKIGILNSKEKKLISTSVEPGNIYPKVSVHFSGQVHVKTNNSDREIIKFNIGHLSELNYPRKICTIFPTNPLNYPSRTGKRKLDTELDLSFVKEGVFACDLYVIAPLQIGRTVKKIDFPINSQLPIGTIGELKYKEHRGFGFFIFVYQTPEHVSVEFNNLENWFFNKNQDNSKQSIVKIKDRVIQSNGIKIKIGEPEIEVIKV